MNYRVFYSYWRYGYTPTIEEIQKEELMRGDDIEADDVEEAAELYAESVFESEDYPSDMAIYVYDGTLWHRVDIEIIPIPTFHAFASEAQQ